MDFVCVAKPNIGSSMGAEGERLTSSVNTATNGLQGEMFTICIILHHVASMYVTFCDRGILCQSLQSQMVRFGG